MDIVGSKQHTPEVFSSENGTRKAVVCSCGFATTYTILSNNTDELGMSHFRRMHVSFTRQQEACNVLRDKEFGW